ncbi:MAG: IS256 family transposase [Candidatus Zixiibacteriota bacterium]
MPKRELDFSSHNVAICMSEVKDLFRMHFEQGCRYVAKRVYDKILAVDFDSFINAGRYKRGGSRHGQRNGYRHRSLLTTVGVLDLRVPRDRESQYQPDMFKRYSRVAGSLEDTIRAMFLRGVSTRKVGEVLEVLCGEHVSASKVSTVTKELDQAVTDFGNSPIDDDFVFLFLDGINVRIRFELKVRTVKLLVAYGIRSDGSRELISFVRANSESTACWKAFLDNLTVRGLKGRKLKLIIMDGGAGLWDAVDDVYPLIEHQLCWVHKLRNVAKYCPKRYRQECVSQATDIMYAESATSAAKLFREWRKEWKEKVPRAVDCLQRDFEKLTPFMQFPDQIRKIIRTTNVIERCFREVRRRLKVMGYFQNAKSCDRITYAIFSYFNDKWKRPDQIISTIKKLDMIAA